MFNTTWNLLVCKELPLNCPSNYSLSFTKLKHRERFFFFFLDFTLMRRFWFGGSELFILTYSASPGGVKKCPAYRCIFCVSHEGSFINDRVAGFGLWSIHFCIWRQMRLKRYTWGKAESMEKRRTLRTVEVIYDPSHFYCCQVTDSVLLIDYICYDVWG